MGTPANAGIGLGPLTEVAVALAVVVLAIFAIAWLLRRLQAGGIAGGSQLRIVAAIAVGPRERVVVVDAAGTQVLLGITPTQITRLHEFPQAVISGERPAGDFAQRLRQALAKGGSP